MIFISSGSRWISATIEMLTSSSMASSRCWRSTRSNRRAFSSAADACSDRPSSRRWSSLSKSPDLLVQHLGDADHLAVLVADRHAEDVARAVAGAPVHLLVEARVGIGVGDDFRLAAGEHRTGDAEVAGEADFADGVALHHAREQFVGFGIMQEQRTAVGVQRLGHDFHQARKQHVQRKAVVDPVGDVGQCRGAAQDLGNAEEQLRLAGLVESVQQPLDILLVQTVLEDLANGFEADLQARHVPNANVAIDASILTIRSGFARVVCGLGPLCGRTSGAAIAGERWQGLSDRRTVVSDRVRRGAGRRPGGR
jgi:hypothetical protein